MALGICCLPQSQYGIGTVQGNHHNVSYNEIIMYNWANLPFG